MVLYQIDFQLKTVWPWSTNGALQTVTELYKPNQKPGGSQVLQRGKQFVMHLNCTLQAQIM